MSDVPHYDHPQNRIEQEAAAWVLRCDRGLTAIEQDEFSAWLANDPRHGAQFARHRRHWNRLDRLAQWRPEHGDRPNPDLLAPPLRRRFRRWWAVVTPLAAAAAIAIAFSISELARTGASGRRTAVATAGPLPVSGQRVLEDGTVVELNRDAVITPHFGARERRVHLERGEAYFTVTRDAARPFIVNAGGIDVRAVGTAFNVRVDAAAVEVLVTEGRVQLAAAPADVPEATAPTSPPLVPVLAARQRAMVSRAIAPAAPQIATLTVIEIERVLAWQHRLLDFSAARLADIVAEFNRRNVVQLVLIDPQLASIRISAAFRSDNIEGFVRLLEVGFGVHAERRGETEILLRMVAAAQNPP